MIAYDPAEMLAVVEAGMRIGDLRRVLAEGGQEWPADALRRGDRRRDDRDRSSSPRRLRMGPLRDTVVEMELVTGDGRLVRSGARTVKSVAGYDVHRLATGSLGTLGAIVQVARQGPAAPGGAAGRWSRPRADWSSAGRSWSAVPLPSAVVATPERVEVALEGWPEEIEEQTAAIRRAVGDVEVAEDDAVLEAPKRSRRRSWSRWPSRPRSSRPCSTGETDWRALMGVGIAWVGLADEASGSPRSAARVAEAGGIAPVIRGPGGLGDAPVPALEVHRRLKAAFDPAGILAPGRFWGGL